MSHRKFGHTRHGPLRFLPRKCTARTVDQLQTDSNYSTLEVNAIDDSSHSRKAKPIPRKRYHEGTSSRRTKSISESEDSEGGHWKSRSKKQKSSTKEDDLSQPWVCEEIDPFTPQIRYFDFPKKTRMSSNDKTYNGSEDPEDHLKIFQAAAKVECWAMPTWCHMFNSTLTGSARGASECMRISRFMHGITNPELTKRLHDNIPKLVDEMMRVTTAFLRGEVAASNQAQKKPVLRRDKFTLPTKSLREILALDKGKFKAPPPMTTPVEKRNNNKFCELYREIGHNTDEVARQRITQSFASDLEIPFPPLGDEDRMEGHMIIKAKIGDRVIHRTYIDGGSALEILYEHCFNKLRSEVKSQMVLAIAPLIGLSGEIIWLLGQTSLPVKIGDAKHSTSTWMNFVVVRSPSPYNRIIGRPGAKPSANTRVAKEKIKVAIHPKYPEQTMAIGSTLMEEGRTKLCDLLRRNLGIFLWKPPNMTGVLRHIAEHRLNIHEGCHLVRQKKRSQAPERNKAIQEEVEKLVEAGIMKEVHYHNWLANPVMVESLYEYPFKCFLDAYKGYHHIKMNREDKEKTTFITSQGIFYYLKMPFGLKNARETYQCLVDKEIQKQIGRNLEVGRIQRNEKLIAELPTLTEPMEKEVLIVYIVVAREAGDYDIQSRPRISIKGQILADLIVEWPNDDSLAIPMEVGEELPEPWTLFTDESSYIDGFGAGLILTNPEGTEFTYPMIFKFDATNNEAEYKALIACLIIVEKMGIKTFRYM
nr:hypothetical protein [Tanacetum cinerariifolium]